MVKRIFPTANIQRIAVGQERLTTQFLYVIRNNPRIVWTQKRRFPYSPKCILIAAYFSLKSIVSNPAVFISLCSFCKRFSLPFARNVVKYTFELFIM